jgi:hypothetical protein
LDRPLPDSLPLALDSEKALLCSCIKSNELVDEPALELELFAFPAHRLIFERLRELFEHGSPIDFVILKDFLARSGELEAVGGATYLSDLWDFVPSPANWRHYVAVLAQVRTRRLGILSCSQLLKELVDPATEIGPDLTERFGSIARRLEASLRVDSSSIEVISQSMSQTYAQPPGSVLLGDCHLVRGNVAVLAGPPGVGKSRATLALAEAGACGYSWFGLPVRTRFKTFILQNENGRARLKTELAELDPAVEDYLRITVPPPFGLCFDHRDFRRDLERALSAFDPDLVVIDPWNAVARDDKARDYLESFDLVRSLIGTTDSSPATLVVPHIRKPLPSERAHGRGLMNLVVGSYVLSSIPRSIFIMQNASDSVLDDRVVVTCCKNNDGKLGPRGCYRRCSGQWPLIDDFDWKTWDHPRSLEPHNKKRFDYTEEVLQILADNKQLSKRELVEQLMALTKISQSAAYNIFDRSWFKTLVQTVRRTGLFKLRS